MSAYRITRRDLLKAGAAAFPSAMAIGGLVDRAAAVPAAGSSFGDIEHIVILMQENRSFDHYFGTMPGVRGFGDPRSYQSYDGAPTPDPKTIYAQTMIDGKDTLYKLASGADFLNPFELVSNPPTVAGQTTNDITHNWGPQHLAWNSGAMDRWAVQHLLRDGTAKWQVNSVDGLPLPGLSKIPIGLLTMGYYRQSDSLAFYRAVADAFTICDGYFCSVFGPTDPNRVMWMSGSLGAHSEDQGGQILETYVLNRVNLYGTLNWPTMPEVLTAHGVRWKVYQDPTSNTLLNALNYFASYQNPRASTYRPTLAVNAFTPVYPVEFEADVLAGSLPAVSWILPPAPCWEHPATPPAYGEWLVAQILETLLLNRAVWEKTVFLVVYDENGGWFDHVAPPTPGPLVTELSEIPSSPLFDGEYLRTTTPKNAAGGSPKDWDGILGPVGLGFRTPALVISPFSAGGFVCSDTFDHISTLKFIEKVFLPDGTLMGPEGLHISPWRYNTVGDMTTALPSMTNPRSKVPTLPETSLLYPEVAQQALLNALTGFVDLGPAYPAPSRNQGIPGPDRDTIMRRHTPG